MALTPEEAARLEYLEANFDESGNPLQVDEPLIGEEAQDENSAAELAAAYAAEIAIGEGGRLAGATAGTAFGGVGAVPGAILGGLGAGAAGSIARQRMLDPEGDLNYGDVVASAIINIVPGGKALKVFKSKGANQALSQGLMGSAIMPAAAAIETSITENRLPTVEELGGSALQGGTMGAGLGLAGSALGKAYNKYAGIDRNELSALYKSGDPDAKILVDGVMRNAREFNDEVKEGYKGLRLSIKEATMDSKARFLELQDQSGGGQYKSKDGKLKVESEAEDFNLYSRLAEPKIQMRNNEIADIVDLDSKWIVAKAEDMGVPAAELSQSVNKYLYSKHAVAFNKSKAKGFKGEGSPAGISTEDAQAYIKNFEKTKLNVELENIINSRKDLSNQILDTLVDGGIVGKAQAKEWRKIFPDYVPLNRVMEDGASFKPGQYTAIGSDRSVADIGDNIIGNLSTAIRAAETNKANQAFLRLVQSDANKKYAGEILTTYKPKKGAKTPEGIDKDSVVNVFVDGENTAIAFKDKRLAQAMRGQNRDVVSGIAKLALGYNRLIGQMYTRFNPEFVIPNLFRDRSEAIVNATAKMGLGESSKLLNPLGDMAVVRRNIFSDGKVSADPEVAKVDAIYKQFTEDGGSTGNLSSSTIANIEDGIKGLQKRLDQPTTSKLREWTKLWDNVNAVVEDSTRFGVYRRGLDAGMSRKEAALAARDSSFDPLMKGSKGGAIQAAYLFANPAIQGSRNFIRSMKNPKVAAGVMASLAATSLTLDLYNQGIDPEWKEKMKAANGSSYKTDKSFTFVTGKNEDGSLNTFSIPIGYSIAPFKKVADYTQQQVIQRGIMGIEPSQAEMDKTLGQDVAELGNAFIGSYNPMGGSLVPTIMRPWTELVQNKDGLGRDIRPNWLETKNISEVEKMFPWTMETRGGEMAISFAEQLQSLGYEVSPENLQYLYQTWVGGPGQTTGRLFQVASDIFNGKPIARNNRPVLRRFFGESSSETFAARGYDAETIENLEKEFGTDQQKGTRLARSTFTEMQSKDSNAERMLVLQNSLNENPALAKQILKSVIKRTENKAAGVTSFDSRVKGLPVAARAKYFIEKMDTMPPEQLGQYLNLQQQRGVLTKSVVQMMQQSQAFRDKFQQR
jgi:hypothetical protein